MPSDRKTEPPTARRLRQARREGDHPISPALVAVAGLACAALLLPSACRWLVESTRELLQRSLQPGAEADLQGLLWRVAGLVSLVLGPAALAALVVGLGQTNAGLSLTPLGWNTRRLNPVQGLARAWSSTTLLTLARWLVSGAVLGLLGLRLLEARGAALAASIGSLRAAAHLAAELVQQLLWGALAVGLGAAIIDTLVVRRAWYARLRMTRDEVQRELRDNEGDAGLKQARQRVHRELSRNAQIDELPLAGLLVMGRPRLATALAYAPGRDAAPRILMHASGRLAQTLESLAPTYGVPVHEDPELARALAALPADEPIPGALYNAVAAALRTATR
jgi:flagellar biosynthesis protein FlhB